MVAHDNIHILKESFPNWIWYVIEVSLVIVISFAISFKVAELVRWDCDGSNGEYKSRDSSSNSEYTSDFNNANIFVETSGVGGTHPALTEAMAFGSCVVDCNDRCSRRT